MKCKLVRGDYMGFCRCQQGMHSGLPLARKFPCRRKFRHLQGKVQGNKIGKEMARIFCSGKNKKEITLFLINPRNFNGILLQKMLKMCFCRIKNRKIFWGRTPKPPISFYFKYILVNYCLSGI